MSGKPFNGHANVSDLRPDFRTELGHRINEVARLFPTKKQMAAVAGVTTEQVRSYTNGNSKPPFEALVRLAIFKNLNLNWLATGEGEMMAAPPGVPGLDEELLQTVVEEIEAFLRQRPEET